MVKIPRVDEPTIPTQIANQPNIPMGFGTAPGRELQRMGQTITQVAAKLTAESNKQQEYETQLRQVQLQNKLFTDYTNSTNNYTTEQDPNKWHAGSREKLRGEIDTFINSAPEHMRPRLKVWGETLYGSFDRRYHVFAQGHLRAKFVAGITGAINSEFGKFGAYDPKSGPFDPEKFSGAFGQVQAGVEKIISAAPGLNEQKKQELRDVAGRAAAAAIMRSVPPAERLNIVKSYLGKYGMQIGKDGQVEAGPQPTQSSAAPGSPRRAQEEGLPQTGAGDGKVAPTTYKFFDTRVPSLDARRAIFRQGGVVVNLDTNWSKAGQTRPMIVIPDDATPAQRQAAQDYVNRIAALYREKFGTTLTPSVVTRSQNGRGRAATIHTEPYSVNDDRAVAFFNSPDGLKAHAAIVRETLGKIPGVHFSIPHNPDKGDHGAAGRRGNEVQFARSLIGVLRGGSADSAPGPAYSGAPVGNVSVTAYGPKAGASNTAGAGGEGGYESSRPGPDGKAVVRTLDDFAAGKSPYITIAGNPQFYGRRYVIPEISYTDANGNTKILRNVPAVVHDTGSAFKTAPEGRFDIPVARDVTSQTLAANHGAWKKAGIKFLPDQSGTAPSPTAPRQPGGLPQLVPSTVEDHAARVLMRQVPQLVRAHEQGIKKAVDGLYDNAKAGYLIPPQQLEELGRQVESYATPQTKARYLEAMRLATTIDALNKNHPARNKAWLDSLRTQFRSTPPTPEQLKMFKRLEEVVTAQAGKTKTDQLTWANNAGVIKIQPLNIDDEEMLRGRLANVQKAAETYGVSAPGQEPRIHYFTAEERNRLSKTLMTPPTQEGAPPPIVAVTERLVKAWGASHARRALAELGQSGAGAQALLGGHLVMMGSTPVSRDAGEGLLLRAQKGYKPPFPIKAEDINDAMRKGLGLTFQAMPQTTDALRQLATAAYENRARKLGWTAFDPAKYKEVVLEILGQRTVEGNTYGGVVGQTFGGNGQILVPPDVRNDSFVRRTFGGSLMDLVTTKMLDRLGGDVPRDKLGNPISEQRWKSSYLISIGDGRYYVTSKEPSSSYTNGDTPLDHLYRNKDGRPYVFDFATVRDTLRARKPDWFIDLPGAGDPYAGYEN